MKRILITKKQLNEYVENKKAEKIFYNIVETLYLTTLHLNENVSYDKINKSIINDFNRRNLITPRVNEMLIKYNIINNDNEII